MDRHEDARKLLSVENLTIDIPAAESSFLAAHNVTFSLHIGETLALVGESGSGKTLTALSLLDLLPAGCRKMRGNITIPGASTNLARLRGRQLTMIFQHPQSALNPVFRIGTQINDIIRQHLKSGPGETKARTLEMLRQVRFADPDQVYRAYPHQLSGGMAQRAMIAMALSCYPKIIIADEPTSSLDMTTQFQILSLIKDLQRQQGFALLLISHDLDLVRKYADNILVMSQGRIVERGSVTQTLNRPRHVFTKSLLDAAFRLSPRDQGAPSQP